MPEGTETVDRWCYAVVLAKFVVYMLHTGITKALSILIPSLVFQLDLNYTTVGFLVPLQYGVGYLTCPISNFVCTKFGPRRVSTISAFLAGMSLMGAFFSYSALSLGCSFFFTGLLSSPIRQTSTLVLHQYFGDEMYGMATTFAQMGSQLGGILLPYITEVCLDAYGMRGTLLCLSGILFFQTASGATMRPPRQQNFVAKKKCKPQPHQQIDVEDLTVVPTESSRNNTVHKNENKTESDEDPEMNSGLVREPHCRVENKNEIKPETHHSKSTWTSIIDFASSIINIEVLKTERVFTFLFLPCQFLSEIGFVIWLTFNFSYGVSVGIPQNRAAYLVIVGAFGGFIGRILLIGILYKRPHLSPHLYAVTSGIASVAVFAYLISSSLLHLLACSFIAGFGIFSSSSCFYAAIPLKVEKINFPMVMAFTFLMTGVTILLSGILTGFLYDLLGSFKVTFLITGVFLGVPCPVFSSYLYIEARLQRLSSSDKGDN